MVATQERRGGVLHGVMGTKASSGPVTAGLALLLVRLVLHWFGWFLL